MLNWIFKKRDNAVAPAGPTPSSGALPRASAQRSAGPATGRNKPEVDDGVDWPARLREALGDDAALLRLASAAPGLDLKMAAVEALSAEGSLRQAEREFRSHDRKVHRLAKQRLETAVARRETRAAAQRLLARAAALLDEADLPINYLVELDQGWDALAAELLEPEQGASFAELRTRLDASVRERGEARQRLQRWMADARHLLNAWQAGVAAAAEQGAAVDLDPLSQTLATLRETRPDEPATAETDAALMQALQTTAAVAARLAWFDGANAPQPGPTAAPGVDPSTVPAAEPPAVPAAEAGSAPAAEPQSTPGVPPAADTEGEAPPAASSEAESVPPGDESPAVAEPPLPLSVPAPAAAAVPRWSDLPVVADAALARVLEQRHERWRRARVPAAAPAAPVHASPHAGHADAATARQLHAIEVRVQKAEQALADGQTAVMQQHLQAIDAAVAKVGAAPLSEALRARHQALRGEGARLKGWKQWGGARARDDLAAEAEALARLTLAAGAPDATDAPKLNLKAHADSIHGLRQRWKELDHLGAVASQALWQRFDAALHAAFVPVAAQHAALKAARQDNLEAREALLARLESLPVPAAEDPTPPDDRPAADWKDLGRELGSFQTAWRKLGPVAHTVPAAARDALQRRLQQAVGRVEGPLHALQRAAAAEREGLITRAETLVSEAGSGRPWPDAARAVRDLQAEWQDHARRLPLPRAVEGGLWARFKAATDAVFAQREAAAAARDATLAAHLAECELLLQRLSAVGAETAPADIERTLAEVERAWRQTGELPRGAGDAMEARFRAGRAAAAKWLGSAARRRWQMQCDALAAQLARCEAHEAEGGAGGPAPSGPGPGDLPAAWAQALAQRSAPAQPVQREAPGEAVVDELLLQLEMALDLPVPPERQAERQMLKLRALKDAMEGRSTHRHAQASPPQPAESLLALLRVSGLTATQRERLHALVAALRQAPPDTLGVPAIRA